MDVREAWERGRARWVHLDLPLEQYRAVAESTQRETALDLQAEDLYLALACLAGVVGAVPAFEQEHREALVGFVSKYERRPDAARELAQELLVEILVGPTARLRSYTGRGPLRAWLRMVATRRSLNSLRGDGRRASLEERVMLQATSSAPDPEAAYLKEKYAAVFEDAFREALTRLPGNARGLLKLHYGEGVALEALGAMYRWSKATASRRVAEARETLLGLATAIVQERLRIDESEMRSLLRLVRSELDVSLAGLLGSSAR